MVLATMILSTLLMFPSGFADVDGTKRYDISGVVTTTSLDEYISGATVILTNLHTGDVYTNITYDAGKFLFSKNEKGDKYITAGYYQLEVKQPNNNYIQTNDSTVDLTVDGDSNPDLQILKLQRVPGKPKYTIQGFVFDEFNNLLENTEVFLKSLDYNGYETVAYKTNDTGEYKLTTFRGSFELWAKAEGYAAYIETVDLNQNYNEHNITLNSTELVIKGIFNLEKNPGDVIPYWFLFDEDNHNIIYTTFSPPLLTIKDIYFGNFSLIVDAPGYRPYYHSEIIRITPENTSYTLEGNKQLKLTNDEKIETKIEFRDDNWNKLKVTETWTLNHDSELFGLDMVNYGDPVTIGDPRFQIDYEPGFGIGDDGVSNRYAIDDEEYTAFINWLKTKGPYHYYTNGYFEINNTHFGWDSNSVSVSASGFQGTDVDSTNAMVLTTTANYNHLPGDSPLNSSYYKVTFSKLRENEIINFNIPSGYEISDPDVYNNATVWVKSSRMCQINYTEKVSIFIVKHNKPTAEFKTSKNYTKAKVDIEFNGEESQPGSGVIVNYTWNFADGKMGYGVKTKHNYTESGVYNVTLTVKTTANLVDIAWEHVTIDKTPPTVVIELENETQAPLVELLENIPTEEFLIYFNGSKSKDTIDGSKPGEILNYLWDFGDGSGQKPVNKVSRHSFKDPGFYTVILNVTDKAGNHAIKELEIRIKDREAPQPKMFTKPANKVCLINESIIINASTTTDNYDPKENITFVWDLDSTVDGNNDGNMTNDQDAKGYLITYYPTNVGPVTITLMVTDKSNNFGHSVDLPLPDWTIDVVGVDLRFAPVKEDIDKFIDFSKSKPKDGDKVKFTINITNEGMVTARDIQVRMYIDGKSKATKTISILEQDDSQELTFKWTASGIKKHKISFNVTLINLSWEQSWTNNEREMQYRVLEKPFWDLTTMIVVIVIVIIIIIVLVYLYVRRRQEAEFESISKKSKKKEKKEKKEKPEKKEKKGKKK